MHNTRRSVGLDGRPARHVGSVASQWRVGDRGARPRPPITTRRARAGEIAEAVLHFLMLTPEAKLSEPWIKFVILGLGFLFLGRQEAVEATVEVAKTLSERVARLAAVTLETCAYAGSGNVLKVQEMLALCGEHIDAEEGHEWQARCPRASCCVSCLFHRDKTVWKNVSCLFLPPLRPPPVTLGGPAPLRARAAPGTRCSRRRSGLLPLCRKRLLLTRLQIAM